ncbi:MAG: hypothetical protein A2Y33_11790 [Spirochaetes bacterium GWF1_51_8]|nr:MAG: hypothetical protein A2Y33_11790 [Spirochaetes bacterium GWF1_51_8]
MGIRDVFEKLSEYVNLNELVFDLTITAAAVFVYRQSGFLFHQPGIWEKIAVIVCVQFFTALFFAGILKRYDELKEDCALGIYPPFGNRIGFIDRMNKRMVKSKIVRFILYLFLFAGVNGLFILMPMEVYKIARQMAMAAESGDANKYMMVVTLLTTGFAVMLAGVMMFKGSQALVRWYAISAVPFISEFIVWPIGIVFFAYAHGFLGAVLFLVGTGGIFAGIIIFKIMLADREIMDKPIAVKLMRPLRAIVIPFLTAVALFAWNDMILYSSVRELSLNHIGINMANIFPYLLLGGLVPVRAAALFAPPVKPVNILISAVTFYLFFANIDAILGGIMEIIGRIR